ncbi:MAG: hypothetical protein ABI744_01975 [Chloroflexota bacterium]
MNFDDNRLAKTSRLLRREAGLRQGDLSTSRFVAQEIEAGRSGLLRIDLVREHFAALGAKAQLTVWWNGAALERLSDQRHAEIVNGAATALASFGFRVLTEFTFNEFGERGSIDLFGGRDDQKAVFVGEAKSEWGSLEETLRRQDLKRRLAVKLAKAAFGWPPDQVASVLIFPNDRTARRVVDRYHAALASYPTRAREIRSWLRSPGGSLNGIWFLSNAATVRRGIGEGG